MIWTSDPSLAEAAREFHSEREKPTNHSPGHPAAPAPLRVIRPAVHLNSIIKPREWIVQDWIPAGGVTTGLYGPGGVGKSLLAQQLQTAGALGAEWAGQVVEPIRSLGVYCEDDESELLRRQAAFNRHYSASAADLDAVALVSRVGCDNILMVFDNRGRGETTPLHKQLLEAARDHNARLVVFDTAADGFAGNENDRGQVRQFISRALGAIAQAIDGAVLLCAHPSRSGLNSGEGDGGSTAWSNTLRSRLYFAAPEDENGTPPDARARILSRKKANYAARNDQVGLTWSEGVFVRDAPQSNIFRPPPDAVFIDLLDALKREGRLTSSKKMAGNFAPRLFSQRPDRQGYKQADFAAAMERLFIGGKIRVEQGGKPSKPVEWIARA